jgi:uncharacterized protein DUF6438
MTVGSTRSALCSGASAVSIQSVQNAMLNSLSRVRQPMINETDTGARHVPVLTPIALMLTIFLVAGCHSLAHPKDLRSVSVTLRRTACYGGCPVYSVVIHGNGLVEYLGELNVDIPGQQTGRIPPEKLLDLLRDFEGFRGHSFLRPSGQVLRTLHRSAHRDHFHSGGWEDQRSE